MLARTRAPIVPDLPPDLIFKPLPQTEEAFEYAFRVKREAMGPHIRARWEWDENFQRDFHRARFEERCFFSIVKWREAIGSFALTNGDDHLVLDDFYLLPAHQGQGLGTRILRHCLAIGDRSGLPVRLRYLKWNPVGSLYRRNGFREIGETEIHFLMEYRPTASRVAATKPAKPG